MPFVGESAALLTSVFWTASAIFFSWSARRIGSKSVNLARLGVALIAILILHALFQGAPFPVHAGTRRFLWLGLSGLIGFSFGDAVLFEAFVRIGPRLSLLVMTLSPVFSALLGRVFLHQDLGAARFLAILATAGGIAWVVAEQGSRKGEAPRVRPARLVSGLLLATGGALGQSFGLLCSRFGMEGDFPALSANALRLTAATLGLGLWYLLRGELPALFRSLKDRTAFAQLAAGAMFGPVVGVTLSLVAIAHASLGTASALMSLAPVFMLPASVLFDHERLSIGSILGTLLTLAGSLALFWV